jgi:hypothetical protein
MREVLGSLTLKLVTFEVLVELSSNEG